MKQKKSEGEVKKRGKKLVDETEEEDEHGVKVGREEVEKKREKRDQKEEDEHNKKYKKQQQSPPQQGLIDYLCLVIRLTGTALWLFLSTTAIWIISPIRPLNFLWRKIGLINNFPLDVCQRMWAKGLFRCMGGEPIVETSKKIPVDQPTVMLYTHGSFYDPVMMGSYAPITAKYVFKKELIFFFPFIFVAAWILGHVPINRSKRNSAISSLQAAADAVKHLKRSVVIAPEGTRTTDGNLQSFKKGPFHLAIDSGVNHVVPVVITNAWNLWPPGQTFPRPGTIRMHFLDPVSTKNETVDTLADKVHHVMEVEIARIKRLNWSPKPPVTRNIGPALVVIAFSALLYTALFNWYYGYLPF